MDRRLLPFSAGIYGYLPVMTFTTTASGNGCSLLPPRRILRRQGSTVSSSFAMSVSTTTRCFPLLGMASALPRCFSRGAAPHHGRRLHPWRSFLQTTTRSIDKKQHSNKQQLMSYYIRLRKKNINRGIPQSNQILSKVSLLSSHTFGSHSGGGRQQKRHFSVSEIFTSLSESVSDVTPSYGWEGVKGVGVVGAFTSGVLAWWRSRRHWQKRKLLKRAILSLNAIEGGTLILRTLSERNLDDILANSQAVKLVLSAAANTTPENPFLQMPENDRWPIQNLFLNSVVMSLSNDGFIMRDMGLPTRSECHVRKKPLLNAFASCLLKRKHC
jgi:hypothetical protein